MPVVPIKPGESVVEYIIAEANRKGWHFWYLEGLGPLLPPRDACGGALRRAYDFARTNGDSWLRKLAAGSTYGYRDEYSVPPELQDVAGGSNKCFVAWYWQRFGRSLSAADRAALMIGDVGPATPGPTPAFPALWLTAYAKEDPRRAVIRSAEEQGANPQADDVQQQAEAAGVQGVKDAKPAIMADLNAQQKAAMARIKADNAPLMAFDQAWNNAVAEVSKSLSMSFAVAKYLPVAAAVAAALMIGGYAWKAWR